MMNRRWMTLLVIAALTSCGLTAAAAELETAISQIGLGWAKNSINAVIFRRNSLVTHGEFQYAAYYDEQGRVILARRELGSADWTTHVTQYKGDVNDAHNTISIMVDGGGYLHMAWNHHVDPLHYCRSLKPESLELGDPMPMTGLHEDHVTYPEFHRLADGGLIFFYRDGASGRGDLMMNRYDLKTGTWTQVGDAFINGEGQRNAYWQAAVDSRGVIHLSWVWRETGDVATNHDLAYARSEDGGVTWLRSNGEPYKLPITQETAEYACRIPQSSELINQTSMVADAQGHPYIATYWRPPDSPAPQFFMVYHDGTRWNTSQVTHRTESFTLSGGGTRRIPISRPQIVADAARGTACVVFRDEEMGEGVNVAICSDLANPAWKIVKLTTRPVGLWEPTYDTLLWRRDKILSLFIEKVGQGDGEKLEDLPPQPVSALDWKPASFNSNSSN
ncbi:MAG: neuraminidase [bacterium]|nr:neuraminidase [bacterium]